MLPGCGRSYEASFRASYKASFEKSCATEVRGLGPKVPAICKCAAQEMLNRLNSLELTELGVHIAPKSIQRKAIDAIHTCVYRAFSNDRPD